MIVKNRLLDLKEFIYQDDDYFKFSIDSVLLANFVTLNNRIKNVIDFACGNAPIPMLIHYRTNAKIYGIEIQKCIYELGVKSIIENHLDKDIFLLNSDVCNIRDYFDGDYFDVVTCNPPYFKVNDDSFFNYNSVKTVARHEISLSIDDVLVNASYLLKVGGIFAMVYPTDRFIEVIEKFKQYNIEPKRIQFIYPKVGKNSDLFLIEGMKRGKEGLKLLSPLVIHNDNNEYTDEVKKILDFSNRGEL